MSGLMPRASFSRVMLVRRDPCFALMKRRSVPRSCCLLGARGDDGGPIGVGETFDHAHAKPYREAILRVSRLQGAVPSGGVDADRQDFDAVVARIAHDLRASRQAA